MWKSVTNTYRDSNSNGNGYTYDDGNSNADCYRHGNSNTNFDGQTYAYTAG